MFKIDDVEYDGEYCVVDAVSESFSLLEGIGSQRLQNGSMWFDIVGTEVSHTVTFRRGNCDLDKWEALWQVIRNPVASHNFTFPDGRNGEINYNGHISGGSRNLDFIDADNNAYWGDYSVTITPISPQY